MAKFDCETWYRESCTAHVTNTKVPDGKGGNFALRLDGISDGSTPDMVALAEAQTDELTVKRSKVRLGGRTTVSSATTTGENAAKLIKSMAIDNDEE
jgi:hypothetical protein